jgi:two-component system cell cycle response regulator
VKKHSKPRLLFAAAPGLLRDQLEASCFSQFEVVEAKSLSAAQEALRGEAFSLILVDQGLLHGKALLLCQEMKRAQGAPILVQVDDPDQRFLEAALHAGAQDFVIGPARSAELRARARLASSARTVSERVLGLVQRLTDLSRRDPLTKLFNRGVLEEWIVDALQSGRAFHLLMLDLDHFKLVNDTYGHAVGDEVLVRVAQLLQQQLRHSDLVIRYGGEEFVILLDGGSAQAAHSVAQKIRRKVSAEKIPVAGGTLHLTISIGLLSVPGGKKPVVRPKKHMKDLLSRADHALYQAKAQGRNQVVRGSAKATVNRAKKNRPKRDKRPRKS